MQTYKLLDLLLQDSKTMDKYFDADQWRRIFISFSADSPENTIGIEILRQHIYEHQKELLTQDATWYKHFSRNPYNPYLR